MHGLVWIVEYAFQNRLSLNILRRLPDYFFRHIYGTWVLCMVRTWCINQGAFSNHLCTCCPETVQHSPAILFGTSLNHPPSFHCFSDDGTQVSMCLGKTSTSTIARCGIKMIALLYNHEIAGESIPSVPKMLLGVQKCL